MLTHTSPGRDVTFPPTSEGHVRVTGSQRLEDSLPEKMGRTKIVQERNYLGLSCEAIILIGLCMADAISTAILVSAGLASEYNPVMAWCLNRGVAFFLLVKIATFIPFVTVCEVLRRQDPIRGRIFIRWAIGAYVLAYVTMITLVNTRVI